MKQIYIVFVFVMCLWAGRGAERVFAVESAGKTLAVIGVKNEIKRSEWDNQLIGYGLSHLVLQGLYDTGRYVPLEDNPEIVRETRRLIDAQWTGAQPVYNPGEAERQAVRLKSDAVAYAVIKKFSTRRKRAFISMLGSAKTKVIVKVEVYLKEQGLAPRISTGQGEAATKAAGVFFHIRQDRVYFDKTAVGRAAQQAITNAIKGLWQGETG